MVETAISNIYLGKSSPLKIYLSKDQVYYSFTLSWHGSCLSVTYLVLDVPYGTWLCIFMKIKSRINILLFIGVVVTSMGITANLRKQTQNRNEHLSYT